MSIAIRWPRAGVFRSIRGRMLFSILAVTIPIYAGALYMSYQDTAQRLEDEAKLDADQLASRLVSRMDAVIRPIEGGIQTIASQLEEIDPPPEQYAARIRGILAAWPDVYGSTIAVEVAADSGALPFAPYLYRRGRDVGYSDLARASYAYRELAWYRRAADSQRPVWSLPYFDAGGGEAWMVTYSVPFFRKLPNDRRVLAGVVTADLDLSWLRRSAAKVSLGPMGMGWLMPPLQAQAFVAPIGATEERVRKFDATLKPEAIRTAAEWQIAGNSSLSLLSRELAGQPAYLAARKLETLDWRLVLIVPRSELLGDARALLTRQLWLGAVGLMLLIVAISLAAAAISRPVHALAAAVASASEDQLAFPLPVRPRRDEVGVLTDALRRMRDSLQKHIQLRAETLAAQARLDRDLQIAARIQQSMLPHRESRKLPPGAAVAAALLPAKQVGGDLYDYFALGDSNLVFAIADVSDKGIPAALFMARVSAMLRVLATTVDDPARLLGELNVRLAEDNDAYMFVTLGCGSLNLATGRLQYASAGHDAPLLRTQEGTVKFLEVENGAALGIDADAEYFIAESHLAPGDTLVLYTDGLTEATADDQSQFGADRVAALLAQASAAVPDALVEQLVSAVPAAGFHASDDLTILAIGFTPPDVIARGTADAASWLLRLAISNAAVGQAQRHLRAILHARDIAAGRIDEAELIAEELLTNVVRAIEARVGSGELSLECTLLADEIALTCVDDGPPFDPLARQGPELDAGIEERDVGGLGILLVRKLSTRCRYEYVDGRNVLEVRLPRTPS